MYVHRFPNNNNQISTSFLEMFKYEYKHIPCFESAYTAKNRNAQCSIWQAGQTQTMPPPNVGF